MSISLTGSIVLVLGLSFLLVRTCRQPAGETLKRRCWKYMKCALLVLGAYSVIFIYVLLALPTVDSSADHQVASAWWALWNLAALLVISCFCEQLCQCLARRARIVQTVERFTGGSIRLAVFINNQAYNERHWCRLTDGYWSKLLELFKTNRWQVLEWSDLKVSNVDSMLDQILPLISGTENSTVVVYLSCHSQMVWGCPQFIPSDASRWGDGYSIFALVRKISDMNCKGVRIHVMLNGCMEFPGRLERWIWSWKYDQDDYRLSSRQLPRKSDAKTWILFACHPGREVSGDAFTRKVLSVLESEGRLGPESQIDCHYDKLQKSLQKREEGDNPVTDRFYPYLITTGVMSSRTDETCEIPRHASDTTVGSQDTLMSRSSHGV